MAENIISQEILIKKFEYRNGVLYKIPQTKRCNPNILVGTTRNDGYVRISINKQLFYAHRLIFMMFHGYMPNQIDHIDGNPSNNKIENLRAANNKQNSLNKPITKANKSGFKNVYWHKNAQKWCVEIKYLGKKLYIGLFDDLNLADLVATEARDKYHNKWAKHY
jgi:hypothetical protein